MGGIVFLLMAYTTGLYRKLLDLMFPRMRRIHATLGSVLQSSIEMHLDSRNPWWYMSHFMNARIEKSEVNIRKTRFVAQEVRADTKVREVRDQKELTSREAFILKAKDIIRRLEPQVGKLGEDITVRFYNLYTKAARDWSMVVTINQDVEAHAPQFPMSSTAKGNKLMMAMMVLADFSVLGILSWISISRVYGIQIPSSGVDLFVVTIFTIVFNAFLTLIYLMKHPVKVARAIELGEMIGEDKIHVIALTNSPSVYLPDYLEWFYGWSSEQADRVIEEIHRYPIESLQIMQEKLTDVNLALSESAFDRNQDGRRKVNRSPVFGSRSGRKIDPMYLFILFGFVIVALLALRLY